MSKFTEKSHAVILNTFRFTEWHGRIVEMNRPAIGIDSIWLVRWVHSDDSEIYVSIHDMAPIGNHEFPGVNWSPLPLGQGTTFYNPVQTVFFRAGLIACREYMARFVEPQDPTLAASIRANWWPSLGDDMGPPRQLDFAEVTEGTFGEPDFRCKGVGEISPTLEALPEAWLFLQQGEAG